MLHERYSIPPVELDPAAVRLVLISECAATLPQDDYYAPGNSLFANTTVQAFNDAGASVHSLGDLLARGVYFTPAVKCGKSGYAIQKTTVEHCSRLLEREPAPDAITRHGGAKRVIPAIATYKLRGRAFEFNGRRVFPSYLQAGASFSIEKVKRKMIAEDLRAVLDILAT